MIRKFMLYFDLSSTRKMTLQRYSGAFFNTFDEIFPFSLLVWHFDKQFAKLWKLKKEAKICRKKFTFPFQEWKFRSLFLGQNFRNYSFPWLPNQKKKSHTPLNKCHAWSLSFKNMEVNRFTLWPWSNIYLNICIITPLFTKYLHDFVTCLGPLGIWIWMLMRQIKCLKAAASHCYPKNQNTS